MCRWVGRKFGHWTDYSGVSFSRELELSYIFLSYPRRIFDFEGKCVCICKFIMPKYYLFVAGSIHQRHERFSDISREVTMFFHTFFSDITYPEFAD